MLEYTESVVIHRPLMEVFAYMQDIQREHEWQPNLREAEQIPTGEPAIGTRRRYVSEFMGRRFENIYIYTAYEPGRQVSYESAAGSDTQAAGEILWEETTEGTRVTMRFTAEPSGLLKLVPRSLIASAAQRELRETLAKLKDLLELEG